MIDHFFGFLEKINIKKRVIDWQCENILCNNDQFIKKNNLYDLQPFIAINPYTSVRSIIIENGAMIILPRYLNIAEINIH